MARRKHRDWGRGWVEKRQRRDRTVHVARWLEDGKQRSKSFTTRADAEDHLDAMMRNRRRGIRAGEVPTVGQVAQEWLRMGRRRWAGSTIHLHERTWERNIAPVWEHVSITGVTPEGITDWVESLCLRVSVGTAVQVASILRRIMTHAVRAGLLPSSPFAGVTLPRYSGASVVVWSADDMRAILDATRDDLWWHAFYAVALGTGMRRGELLALRWSDVDLERGVLHVQRTITEDARGRWVMGTTTKNRKPRKVALPGLAVEALARREDRQGLVFAREDGRIYNGATLHYQHLAWCGRAGVPHIRIHDMRHSVATLMLMNNVNVRIVSDLLGHSKTSITMEIYQHVSEEMTRQAASVVDLAIPQRNPPRK